MSNIDTQATKERLKKTFLTALCTAYVQRCPLVSASDAYDVREALGEWADIVTDGVEPEPLDADHALCAIMSAHGLVNTPGAFPLLKRKQGLLVFICSEHDLVDVLKQDLEYILRAAAPDRRETHGRRLFEFLTGQHKTERVIDRLREGRMLIDVVPTIKGLDKALRRLATVVELPRMDGTMMGEVVHALSGEVPEANIEDVDARRIELVDLIYLMREEGSAEDRVRRLKAFVADCRASDREGKRLEDAQGYGQARTWGMELAQDLSDYALGRIDWTEVDRRGLLLSGDPGTGKTQYAKLLARQAEVPLIESSVSAWQSAGHLGNTLKAIDKTFARAISAAPAVLFIDEIDGIANRTTLEGEYVEYWTQVVNHVLAALGDEAALEGVVVIAATNHPQKIDPAVLRAGRIADHLVIERPDAHGRAAILQEYLGEDAKGVDIEAMARAMHGATGADIAHTVRQARSAARRQRRTLDTALILEIVGRSPEDMPKSVRRMIAVHEAGHAVVGHLLGLDVAGATLVGYGGWTAFEKVVEGTTVETVRRRMRMVLAGRAAESVLLGRLSTSSGGDEESDLAIATRLATHAVGSWGIGPDEPVHVPSLPGYARSVAEARIEQGVRTMIRNADEEATRLVEENREAIEALADLLMDRGYVGRSDVRALTSDAEARRTVEVGSAKSLPKPDQDAAAEVSA